MYNIRKKKRKRNVSAHANSRRAPPCLLPAPSLPPPAPTHCPQAGRWQSSEIGLDVEDVEVVKGKRTDLEQYENLEASHEEHRGSAEGSKRKSPGSLPEQGPRVSACIGLDLRLAPLPPRGGDFVHRNGPVRRRDADDTSHACKPVLVHGHVQPGHEEEFRGQLVILGRPRRRSSGWTEPTRRGPRQDDRAQSHRVIRALPCASLSYACRVRSYGSSLLSLSFLLSRSLARSLAS